MIIHMTAQEFSRVYGKTIPCRTLIMRYRDSEIEVSMCRIRGTYVCGYRAPGIVRFATGDEIQEVYSIYRDIINNKEAYLYA